MMGCTRRKLCEEVFGQGFDSPRLHHVVRTKKMHPEKRRFSCVFLVFSPIFLLFQKSVFECQKKMQSADFAFLSETNPCLTKNTIFEPLSHSVLKIRCGSFLFHVLTTYERSDLPSHSNIRKKTSTANSVFTICGIVRASTRTAMCRTSALQRTTNAVSLQSNERSRSLKAKAM